MNLLRSVSAVVLFTAYGLAACAEAPPPQPVVAPVAPAAGCLAAGNPCVGLTGTTVNIGGGNCCSGACTNGFCQ